MIAYIFPLVIIVLCWLYYKHVILHDKKLTAKLEEANKPKDTNNAQDEDFCAIAAVIGQSRTENHLISCAKAIGIFRNHYGHTVTGEADALSLFALLEKQNDDLLEKGALTGL